MKEHYYLRVNDVLSAFGRSEEEVYTIFTNTVRKPRTVTHLKQSCRVISKWFIKKTIARGGHNDFVHSLQILFLPSIKTKWCLNIGHIIYEYMWATDRVIASCSPPGPKMMLLLYWITMTVILASFGALSTALIVYHMVSSTLALSNSCTSTFTQTLLLCPRFNCIHLHLSLHQPATLSLLPPVPFRHNPLVLFLWPPQSSLPMTFSNLTLQHYRVPWFLLVSTKPPSLTNYPSLHLLVHPPQHL